MLPDYIIYDELKRERNQNEERPRVEIPSNDSRPEFEDPEEQEESEEEEHEEDRGVTIIQI